MKKTILSLAAGLTYSFGAISVASADALCPDYSGNWAKQACTGAASGDLPELLPIEATCETVTVGDTEFEIDGKSHPMSDDAAYVLAWGKNGALDMTVAGEFFGVSFQFVYSFSKDTSGARQLQVTNSRGFGDWEEVEASCSYILPDLAD